MSCTGKIALSLEVTTKHILRKKFRETLPFCLQQLDKESLHFIDKLGSRPKK